MRNMEQPLVLGPLNDGSGVPYFYYDSEYKVMILVGRGDNVANIYSFDKSSPTVLNLLQTQNFLNTTQKAFCLMPKHAVDVSTQEVMKSVRVTNTGKIDVLSMRIPSRIGGFNQDYYPPFVANEPSSTAEAWCAGNDVPAKTMQMTGAKKTQAKKQSGLSRLKTGVKAAAAEETKASGSDNVSELKAQIAVLERELRMAKSVNAGPA